MEQPNVFAKNNVPLQIAQPEFSQWCAGVKTAVCTRGPTILACDPHPRYISCALYIKIVLRLKFSSYLHSRTMPKMAAHTHNVRIDAFKVLLNSYIAPSGDNLDKIKALALIGRSEKQAAVDLYESELWKKWRADVAHDLQNVVPWLLLGTVHPMTFIRTGYDVIIQEVLQRYTDSAHVQARILSMMFVKMYTDRVIRDYAKRLYVSVEGASKPDFVQTICRVMSSADAARMCETDVYVNVMQLLKSILVHGTFAFPVPNPNDSLHPCVRALFDTCFSILQKIHNVQLTRSSSTTGSADPSENVPRRREDLVGARKREDLLQVRSLELLDAALLHLVQLQLVFNGHLHQPRMKIFVQDNMSRVLSLYLLFSENRTIAGSDDCSPCKVTSNFLKCYRLALLDFYAAADSASHDLLALYLQQMVNDMQKIMYKEASAAPEYKLGGCVILQFDNIVSTMRKYDKSVQAMAVHAVPTIVQCMHFGRECSLEISGGFAFFEKICHMTAGEHDVAEIQRLIVTNLTAKYYNKDVFDVLLASHTTYNAGPFTHNRIMYTNYNLFHCIHTIFRNPVHHNAFCITLLLRTRLFDILVLSLINCTRVHGFTPGTVMECRLALQVLLQLLERKPYQRGCGFIFFTVETQELGAASGTPVQTEEFCRELPGVDCTSTTLSTGKVVEMCRRLVNTGERQILSYNYKIRNIATALMDVMDGDGFDSEHQELCFKILSRLTETHDEIRPEIGLEWSASQAVPHCDQDSDGAVAANYSLLLAVQRNPMLTDALRSGRLHFSASDWQDMSAKQGLFVPVNSLVYQRGLSGRGCLQIGSVYFRPLARDSMQALLGLGPVRIVLRDMLRVASRVERITVSGQTLTSKHKEIDTTEHGVMFRSLLFLESMLDQIMDIETTEGTATQSIFMRCLADVLSNARLSTTLYQITCHIIDQYVRKLDIPAVDEILGHDEESEHSQYEALQRKTKLLQFLGLGCGVYDSLFRLLGSSLQATEEECLVCFYACTSLVQIYKIRPMKYSRELREKNVDAALIVTRKNIRKNTGFLATALLEEITKLQACCEEGSTSSFLRQVLCRWRSWRG